MSQGRAGILEFWKWFREHDAQLQALASADDALWDVAVAQLQRVHEGLRFEISEAMDGVRELVITAGGRMNLFPLVDEVVDAAPAAHGWAFRALKPAMGFDFVTTYEGELFDARTMWFLPLESASRPTELGLRLGISGLTERSSHVAARAIPIVLETGLGERTAAADVQHLEVVELPQDPERAGYIELPELPAYIAWRKRRAGQ